MYAAYAAGDFNAIPATITHRAPWAELETSIFRAADRWKSAARDRRGDGWQPVRVAFLVELARAVHPIDAGDGARLFGAARELVALRPGLAGEEQGRLDEGDRFEITVHRSAIAILLQEPSAAKNYLNAIASRLSSYRRSTVGAHLIARLDLAPVLIAEAATMPFVRDSTMPAVPAGVATPANPFTIVREPPVSVQRRNTEDFERALAAVLKSLPPRGTFAADVDAEVEIRRGLILYRLGRHELALESLARGLASTKDVSVRYWGLLFSGRALQSLGRTSDAVRQYDMAVRVAWPRSQTAAVALAAAHLLTGARAQAEAWARIARTLPAGNDPWWEYWYGDRRFGEVLVAELRSAFR